MTALIEPGTPIAVVAPSRAFDSDKLERGLAIARARGHDLRVLPGLLQPERYLAAPDAVRAGLLIEALTSTEYGAVWAVRGGYGMTRLLDRIPWSEIVPKPFLGFSDMTAFFGPWHAAGGLAVHAPMLHTLVDTDQASLDQLFALLAGEDIAPLAGETWVPGEAEGWLCGGNLCMFAATAGTPHQLRADGAIVVIEEVDEVPYRVDRLFQQCLSAGIFEGVRGVALGSFTNCDPPEGADYTLRDVLMDHLEPLGVPVLAGLPVGHGVENHAFPWGGRARIADGALSW